MSLWALLPLPQGNQSIVAYATPRLGEDLEAHLLRHTMHWFLTPFLGSTQKHSSGCPCFQIPQFIHKFSYSSGELHLLASPPRAFSSNPRSPKSIRVDEGAGWMRRLAEPSCIFSKPNGCVRRVFWKPHSQALTSWPLFLKPTCPKAWGERAARNTWERI